MFARSYALSLPGDKRVRYVQAERAVCSYESHNNEVRWKPLQRKITEISANGDVSHLSAYAVGFLSTIFSRDNPLITPYYT